MKNIFFCVLMSLFFVGCNQNNQNQTQIDSFKEFSVGEKINLKSVVGGEITLVRSEKGFKIEGSNKILMIDIFGTYCAPCKSEAAHLMDFQFKNADKFTIVALTSFENISDKDVVENFSKKYNAYYFISNQKDKNERIIKQILKDINYQHALSIPFKVIFKDGKYQKLTNYETSDGDRLYYIGALPLEVLQNDFERISK